ncbi:MAG: NAD(P)H-dependent oxidoreductase subunit E [Salinivirgaceae bacterium]|nr:NAD(P)H-dependent oxidoreductase subunit E [Salinivirgaceae bacterium]
METKIVICQGSSCFSRGNKQNLAVIQNYLKNNNLMADVSFKGQLCSNKCDVSPIIIINGEIFTEMDEPKTLKILAAHFKK